MTNLNFFRPENLIDKLRNIKSKCKSLLCPAPPKKMFKCIDIDEDIKDLCKKLLTPEPGARPTIGEFGYSNMKVQNGLSIWAIYSFRIASNPNSWRFFIMIIVYFSSNLI